MKCQVRRERHDFGIDVGAKRWHERLDAASRCVDRDQLSWSKLADIGSVHREEQSNPSGSDAIEIIDESPGHDDVWTKHFRLGAVDVHRPDFAVAIPDDAAALDFA